MEETEKKDTNNDDDREVDTFKEPEQMVENMNDTDEVEIFEVADNNLKEVENEEELRLSNSEGDEFAEEARTVAAKKELTPEKEPVAAGNHQEIKPSYEQWHTVDLTEEVVKETEAKKNKPGKKVEAKEHHQSWHEGHHKKGLKG